MRVGGTGLRGNICGLWAIVSPEKLRRHNLIDCFRNMYP